MGLFYTAAPLHCHYVINPITSTDHFSVMMIFFSNAVSDDGWMTLPHVSCSRKNCTYSLSDIRYNCTYVGVCLVQFARALDFYLCWQLTRRRGFYCEAQFHARCTVSWKKHVDIVAQLNLCIAAQESRGVALKSEKMKTMWWLKCFQKTVIIRGESWTVTNQFGELVLNWIKF